MSKYLNNMLNTLDKEKKGREALSLNTAKTAYGQSMMDTLAQDIKKKQQRETLDMFPYTTQAVNMKFQQVYSTLNDAAKKYGTASADPYEDALKLTDRYGDTVRKSYSLFGGNTGKDYLTIAENDFKGQLQQTLWDYQYRDETPEQQKAALEGLGFQSPKNITKQNEINVINYAMQQGAGNEKAAALKPYIDAASNMTGVLNKARTTGWGSLTEPEKDAARQVLSTVSVGGMGYDAMAWDEMNDRQINNALSSLTGARGNAVDKMGKQLAAKMAQDAQLTYEDADKALKNSEAYQFAKQHPGDLGEYENLFSNLSGLAERVKTKGINSLNDKEQEVYYYAAGQMNDLEDISSGKLAALGTQFASDLQNVNGLISAYQPTEEQNYLLGMYRNTLEGAKDYLAEAQGTDEEEKARENLWRVEKRTKFNEVLSSGDYQKYSAPVENFNSGEQTFDLIYQVINNQNGVRQGLDAASDQNANAGHLLLYTLMNDQEKGIFNTLANSGKYTDAKEYLDYIDYDLNKRANEKTEQYMNKLAKDGIGGAVAASALSVPFSVARGFGALDIAAQNIGNMLGGYRPVDYARGQSAGVAADAARGAVMENYDWNMNILGRDVDAFDFLYSTIMSGVDSYAAGAIGKGLGFTAKGASKVAGAILGSGAGQDTMMDIHNRGGNNYQVLVGGALGAFFEGFFEEKSISKLFKDMDTLGYRKFADRLKTIGTEALTNFSEEFNTEVADIIMDYMVMGDLGNYQQSVKEYERLGMSRKEAKNKAISDLVYQAFDAGLSGALMGAGFGEVANIGSNSITKKTDKQTGSVLKKETLASMVDLAEQLGGEAGKVAEKIDAEKATNRQAGELTRTIFNQLSGKHRNILIDRMAVDLQDADISRSAAQNIALMMAGQELGPEQIQSLARDEKAMDVLITALGQKEGTPKQKQQKIMPAALGEENRLNGSEAEDFEPMPTWQRQAPERPNLNTQNRMEALDGEAPVSITAEQRREETERPQIHKDSTPQDLRDSVKTIQDVTPEARNVIEGVAELNGLTVDKNSKAWKNFESIALKIYRNGIMGLPALQDVEIEGRGYSETEEFGEFAETVRELGVKARREAKERPMLNTENRMEALEEAPGERTAAEEGLNGQTRENGKVQNESRETASQAREEALFENDLGITPSAPAGQLSQGENQEKRQHGRVMEVTLNEEDGTITARMEDGTEQNLIDTDLTEEQQEIAKEAEGLPQDVQALMTRILLKPQKKTRAQQGETGTAGETETNQASVENRAKAFKKLYNMAALGQFEGKHRMWSLFAEFLEEEERQAAIRAGRKEYQRTKDANAQATRDVALRLKREKGIYFRTLDGGDTTRGGVYLAKVTKDMSNGAVAQLQVIDKIADEYGFQVRVYDHMDDNGFYLGGSNVIHVALDAEEGMIGRASSHELFHYIKSMGGEAATKLQNYILNALKNTEGYDYEGRIAQIMDGYAEDEGQKLGREAAEEEMAAEGMLDVFDTEENLRGLFSEVQDKSLLEKIRDWLTNTARKIKDAIDRLAWNHAEVRALKDNYEYIKGKADLVKAALEEAQNNYMASQRGLYSEAAADPDVQAYTEAVGKRITAEDALTEAETLNTKLFLRAEQEWLEKHPDQYEDALQKYFAAQRTYARGESSLLKAFADAGLDTPKKEMYSALAYAGRQLVEREQAAKNGGAKFSRKEAQAEQGEKTEQFKRWFDDSEVVNEDGSPKVMYHGTASDFWAFDMKKSNDKTGRMLGLGAGANKIYLTENRASAEMAASGAAARTKNGQERVLGLYVSAQKVMDRAEYNRRLQEAYKEYPNSDPRGGNYDYKQRDKAISAVDKQVKAEGYDAVWDRESGEMFVYSNTQVKSATDNIGTFDGSNPDIRFSRRADTDQRREDQALESVRDDPELYAEVKNDPDSLAALMMLRQLHSLTTSGGEDALIRKGAFEKRLSDIADGIIEKTGTKYGKRKLTAALRKVYTAMEESQYNVGELLQYTRSVMWDLLEASPGVLVEQDETTKEIIKELKNSRFYLTDDQKSEIQNAYGTISNYTRKNFGKMHIVKRDSKTSSLAEFWRESLTPLNPATFAEDTNELDMPGILDAWLEHANEKKFDGEYGANIGRNSTDLALNAMLDFYDVPGALKTKADIREGFREQYEEQARRIRELTATAREAVNTAREEYAEKYRQRIEKAQERRQETERKQDLRKKITRDVRHISLLNVRASDTQHVPEEMRAAALQAVEPFLAGSGVFNPAEMLRLSREYQILKERAGEVRGFDEDILTIIEGLPDRIAGRRLSELTEAELQDLADIMGNLRKMIADANEAFVNGRRTTVDALSGQLKADMREKGQAKQGPIAALARKFQYLEETPVYFADRVGGVIKDMIADFFQGESDWSQVVNDAIRYKDEMLDKYHVKDWINDRQHARFVTQHGDQIELDRQQAMTLYAQWKREQNNRLQNAAHLRVGGFMYGKGVKYEGVDTMKPHPLTESDMQMIRSYLTDEQMAFADAMVKYLSEDMAKIGNEVSMRLYGYEKYKEDYYFPYGTDKRFLVSDLTQTGEQVRQPKSQGFTKALMQNAATPLTVDNFMDMWGSHVNQMALYKGFAEAVDTMSRVFNQRAAGEIRVDSVTGEEFTIPPESNWIEMERALGAEGVDYLKTLVRDVSGGVRADERGFGAKGLGLFKKGAVLGNLSVVLQQPTAYARAMNMINPAYLNLVSKETARLPQNIREMYEYSGVARIKKMGRFDTGTGKGAIEMLTDGTQDQNAAEKTLEAIDKVAGIGAEKADEWTWGLLWGAVKKETAHNHPELQAGSEEFLRAAAARFDDICRHTQVYDSVLSKSTWMRSSNIWDKITTSFMAEPTLSLNMLLSAMETAGQPGGARKIARAAGTFAVNSLLVALAKSIMTASRRKKDEGRTWLEKYLAESAGNFLEDISPFGLVSMIPYARDMVSLLEGYDVKRSDMDAAEQLIKGYKSLKKYMEGGDVTLEDTIQNTLGPVANLFGIPLKNLWRDTEAIIGNVFGGASAGGESTARDIKYSVLDNLSMGPVKLWDSSRSAYYNRMEQALLAGDMDRYNELRGYMEETNQVKPDAVTQGIKKELKASVQGGLISDDRALSVIEGSLGMDQDKAWALVDKWVQEKDHEGDEDYSYQKYSTLWDLMDAGKDLAAEKKRLAGGGVTEKAFDSAVKQHIGDQYKEGAITEKQAESLIKKYMGETDAEKIHWILDEWAYKRDNGSEASYSRYADVFDAVKNGKSLTAPMKEMTANGYEEKEVKSEIRSQIGKWYKNGELTKAQTESKLKQYAGITDANDLYWAMDQLDYEKANAKNKSAAGYAKYASYYKAVETGNNLTQETNRYLSHGVKKETMSSQITSNFKPQYTALVNAGRKAEADKMMERLLRAYELLGYERSKKRKDIEKWLK